MVGGESRVEKLVAMEHNVKLATGPGALGREGKHIRRGERQGLG